MNRDLDFYRMLPYGRTWETRGEGDCAYFLVRISEIPNVAGDGVSRDEALRHVRVAFDDYICWALDEDVEVPLPNRPFSLDEPTDTLLVQPQQSMQIPDVAIPHVTSNLVTTVSVPAVDRRYEVEMPLAATG